MKFSKTKHKRVRPLLGTYVEITLEGSVRPETLNAWITKGFAAVEEIERLMSRFRSDSDLSRLNQAQPREWVAVESHTARVLRASNDLFRISKGIFDVRCSTVPANARPPIEISGTLVRKTGPWSFDLGGIAKGYAVDCAVEVIKQASQGLRISGIVNAGGDLRRWGPGRLSVAVATSAVRTLSTFERLSDAVHVQMPQGNALTDERAVTVASARCLWSDALTKIMLLAPQAISSRCLEQYQAQALYL